MLGPSSHCQILQLFESDHHRCNASATHRRKTFVIGFVATIKSTIEMANQMLSSQVNPFKYLLTFKFSQDHMFLKHTSARKKAKPSVTRSV